MRIASERLFVKLIKGSLAGLVLAGILAIAPTAQSASGDAAHAATVDSPN
jgi:hypothetical protein